MSIRVLVVRLMSFLIAVTFAVDSRAQNDAARSAESPAGSRGAGVVVDDTDYLSIPLKPTFRSVRKDESRTSYSLKKYAPYAGNQGVRNTSVGWALSYSARTIAAALNRNWNDRSYITEHAYSPSFVYNRLMVQKGGMDGTCMQGTKVEDGLRLLKTIGTVKKVDFPVSCTHRPDSEDDQRAFEHRIFQYSRLFSLNEQNKTSDIKKSIRERKPVIVVMKVPPSLYEADGVSDWAGSTSKEDGVDWHVMTIVAYDDDRNGGAFEVMNSWGPYWGTDGFIWMPYAAIEKYVGYAYEVHVAAGNRLERMSGSVSIEVADAGILQTTENAIGNFRTKIPLPSGTTLRIRSRSAGPVFMYIISSDLSRSLTLLFPDRTQKESAFISFEATNIWESPLLELDESAGTDYLSVVLSTEQVNLEHMLKTLQSLPGDLPARLHRFFASARISSQHIEKVATGVIDYSYSTAQQSTTLINFVIDHSDPSEEIASPVSIEADRDIETIHPALELSPRGTHEIGEEVRLVGRVLDIRSNTKLFVNGRSVDVSPSGRFSTSAVITDRTGLVLFEFIDTSGRVRSIRRYLGARY